MDARRREALRRMTEALRADLYEDYKSNEWQRNPARNYQMLYKYNTANWMTMLLIGKDPNESDLKPILERLRAAMVNYEKKYPSGDPGAIDFIHSMFENVYNL
ncbi:unnamed protein product [Spodoptera exigua]|nr:unnamed protein product [Spodoptera exigua]